MEFQLRQDPEDSCILQQTLDGGDTWSDVFDFSLCTAINESTNPTNIYNTYVSTLNQFQQTIYNNYVENYAGDITNIHPELGYGDSDDGFRNHALCYALLQLINAICAAAIEIIENTDEVADDARTALAVVGAVLGILLLAGTGIGLPAAALLSASLIAGGIGLGTVIAIEIYDYLSGKSTAIFEDTDAIEELQCALYEEMKDSNADHSALIAAFSAVSGLSSNAMDIAGFGSILVAELAMYASFAENLNIALASAKLGLLPPCPCEPSESAYMKAFDFTSGLNGWIITQGVQNANGIDGIDTGDFKAAGVYFVFAANVDLVRIRFVEERTNGIANGSDDSFTCRSNLNTDGVFPIGDSFFGAGGLSNGMAERCTVLPSPRTMRQVLIQCRVTDNATSDIYLKSIELTLEHPESGYIEVALPLEC
jgi:hypothetical protein